MMPDPLKGVKDEAAEPLARAESSNELRLASSTSDVSAISDQTAEQENNSQIVIHI